MMSEVREVTVLMGAGVGGTEGRTYVVRTELPSSSSHSETPIAVTCTFLCVSHLNNKGVFKTMAWPPLALWFHRTRLLQGGPELNPGLFHAQLLHH